MMRRVAPWMCALSLLLAAQTVWGWGANNPAGDIQPLGGAGGGTTGGNANYATSAGNANTASYATSASNANTSFALVGSGPNAVTLDSNGNIILNNPNSYLSWGSPANYTSASDIILGSPLNPNYQSGGYGVFIGYNGFITGGGIRNICIGNKCYIFGGQQSVAIGSNAACANDGCVSVGYNAGSSSGMGAGQTSVSVGKNSTAYGAMTTTVGGSAACGNSSLVSGVTFGATCLGAGTINNQTYSTALGYGATTTAAHQVMLGTSSENVVVPGPLGVSGITVFSAPALGVAGTAAAPGITVGDPNTGIFKDTTNSALGLSYGGTQYGYTGSNQTLFSSAKFYLNSPNIYMTSVAGGKNTGPIIEEGTGSAGYGGGVRLNRGWNIKPLTTATTLALASNNDDVITNEGAAGNLAHTLPASTTNGMGWPVDGMVIAAFTMSFSTQGSDKIYCANCTGTPSLNTTVTSPTTKGAEIYIRMVTTNTFVATALSGSWSIN